jgi:hypothetical protein
MTRSEMAAMAERICRARDRDPADARAMLHQLDHDHGRDVALAVAAMCRIILQRRSAEVAKVFAGLPSTTSFGDALRIKRAQHDPSAEGWQQIGDAYAKLVRA